MTNSRTPTQPSKCCNAETYRDFGRIMCSRCLAVVYPTPKQDGQTISSLMSQLGKKIVNGIAISIAADKDFDTQPIEDWLAKEFEAYCTEQKRLAELQARANALYEAADLVKSQPEMYKLCWDRRLKVLAELQQQSSSKEAHVD